MSRDFERWDNTPPDPPAIVEAAHEESKSGALVSAIALLWVLAAAMAVGACWVIWRAWSL